MLPGYTDGYYNMPCNPALRSGHSHSLLSLAGGIIGATKANIIGKVYLGFNNNEIQIST